MPTLPDRITNGAFTSVISGPVFAAEWNEQNQLLTVHTCASKAAQRSDVVAGASDGRVAIKTHTRRALQSPRSLEALALAGTGAAIVYDPTQIFTRARLLVQAVRTARARLPGQIASCYFQAGSRTLLVVPTDSVQDAGSDALRSAIGAVLAEIDAKGEIAGISVRVSKDLPRFGNCLAVDNLSPRPSRHLRGLLRGAVAALFSTGLLAGATAHAATPADHGLLGGLSVFADGMGNAAGEGFVATGLAFFFGEDGASSRIELQLAQGAQGDSGPGLRIVVNPERQIEDGPELRRPSWSPYSGGAGPGGGNATPGNSAGVGTSS